MVKQVGDPVKVPISKPSVKQIQPNGVDAALEVMNLPDEPEKKKVAEKQLSVSELLL
jgi:hypothetical protein